MHFARLLLAVVVVSATSLGIGGQGHPPRALASIVPNDDLFEQYQWNLRQIRAPDAWDLTTGSSTVVIAVLDTGVSPTHPDLIRKLVPGYNFVNDSAQPDDDHGNGTHVAGIAAADTNNQSGIAGIAWQARIMPVKVLDSSARGDPAVAARGVTWAVDRGATVINLGLTGPDPSDALAAAVNYAYEHGVTVVAPVANNGTDESSYPAAYPHVIAVAATDRSDKRLSTSNTGSYISIAAPGERIPSTFRAPGNVDTYAVASGTAQAAAHVTGVIALMLSINPGLKPDDIRSILESSADDLAPAGRDSEVGAGRLNALRALQFAAPWNFQASGASSYVGSITPTTTIYFPLAAKNAGGWSTSFTLQNPSAKPLTFTMELLDSDGKTIYTLPGTLAALGSTTYQPAQLAGLPSGYLGSATVYGDGPIVGVANQDQARKDRLSYEGISSGASSIWLPLLMRSYNGWDTGIRIQNVSGAPARARVTYYTNGSSMPLGESVAPLAALGSTTLYQPSDIRIPENWSGSAIVESLDEQLLAVTVNEVNASGANASYTGTIHPGPNLYAPLVFRNGTVWNTGVRVQNTANRPTSIAATFLGVNDPLAAWFSQRLVDPFASASVSRAGEDDVPDGFVGSAAFRSIGGSPLAGVANQIRSAGDAGTAYRLPSEGAPLVYLPLVYRNFAGWETGLQVQNLSNASTRATVSIYQQDGTLATTLQESIDVGSAKTFYLPDVNALPSGFIGSAIVTSSGGAPIAAIANHVK